MLAMFRRHLNSWVARLFFLLLVGTFVLWGVGDVGQIITLRRLHACSRVGSLGAPDRGASNAMRLHGAEHKCPRLRFGLVRA